MNPKNPKKEEPHLSHYSIGLLALPMTWHNKFIVLKGETYFHFI
jgi:hypothetical protein